MYIIVLLGTTSSPLYKSPSLDVAFLDSDDSVSQLQSPSKHRDDAFLGWMCGSMHSVDVVYLFIQIRKHVANVGVRLDGVEDLRMFLANRPHQRK